MSGKKEEENKEEQEEIIPNINASPKLLRQVTNAYIYLGNPIADEKFQMNNEINKVKRGDEGYLPTSKSFNELPKIVQDNYLDTSKR